MQQMIQDYTITGVIKEENNVALLRASKSGAIPATLKIVRRSLATSAQLQNLTHEFEIEKNLVSSHATHAYELVATEELLGFSMENFPPLELNDYLNFPSANLEDRLAIGIDLCEGVGEIHQANIAHRNLGLRTVFLDPESKKIKIADFDYASIFPSEEDFLLDLKSLGTLLETLLRPFEIPPPLTKAIQKCIQGEYHSAYSLRYDLSKTLDTFRDHQIVHSLTSSPIYDHFHIPEQLFGRQKDLYAILQWCNDVWNGDRLMLFLSGPIGSGKTVLVEAIGKNISMRQGTFLKVHFDPIKKNIPYKALSRALAGLFNQIADETGDLIPEMRKKLVSALGDSSQVIAELVPEIQKLIPVQGPVTLLTAQENHNRLRFLLIQLFKALIEPEKPMVIFLDNMEYADESTLGFIRDLLNDTQIQYLFVIGAFDTHPTSLTFKEISTKGENNVALHLEPLSYDSLFEMILATVPMVSLEHSQKLAVDLLEKSGGNPLYALQLLKLACEEKFLVFDPVNLVWEGDESKIKAFFDAVVLEELPKRQIKKLNHNLVNLLKLTTSLETPPEINLLSEMTGQTIEEVKKGLTILMQNGLLNSKHAFHQQVSLFIQDEERDKIHLQIARALHKHLRHSQHLETAFYYKDLNPELFAPEEKIPIASLFLEAGLKAKNRGAYLLGIQYFTKGIELLPEKSWETEFDLTDSLKQQLGTTLVVNGNYQLAEKVLEECVFYATNDSEKCRLFRELIFLYGNLKEFDKLFATAKKALACYNFPLEVNTTKLSLLKSYLKLKTKMAFKEWDDFTHLPEVSDKRILDILSLLSLIFFPTFLTNNKTLFTKTAIDMINLTIDHGASYFAPIPLATYAMILGSSLFNDFENSAACGDAALKLTRRYPKKGEISGAVCTYYSFIHRWKHPLRESILPLRDNLRLSLETGGGFVGTTNATYLNLINLLVGTPLDEVQKGIQYSINELKKYSTLGDEQFLFVHREVCKALRGFTNDFTDPLPPEFNDSTVLSNPLNELRYKIWRTVLLTLFNQWKEGVAAGEKVLLQRHEFPNWPEWNIFYFYYALALASSANAVNPEQNIWKRLVQVYKKLKKWADASPFNYAHHALLVSAEMERLQGNSAKAELNYTQAVASALNNQFYHEAAVALEYFGRFCIEQKHNEQASIYFNQAFQLFSKWGAEAKKREFRLNYSNFLDQLTNEQEQLIAEEKLTATGNFSGDVDVNTLMENSIALTQEIQLKNLADSILQLGELSGGDQGHLIINKGKDALLYASKKKNEPSMLHRDAASIEANQHLLPLAAVKAAIRSKSIYRATNPHLEETFELDPYVLAHKPKNILTLPFIHKGQLTGLLYLENLIEENPFTKEKISHLTLLAPQIAIALENAQYYEQIEQKVEERKLELQRRNLELREALQNVEKIHEQQLQQEKLASLGLLSSGIAHELKNPLNFIINFSQVAKDQLTDIENSLEIQATFEESLNELQDSVVKIDTHSNRAETILERMLQHTHANSQMSEIDLHALIEQAFELSFTAYQKKNPDFSLDFKKAFGNLSPLNGQPSDLMRVFINLFDNAFYAMDQKRRLNPSFEPVLKISTQLKEHSANIIIKDNGIGISKEFIKKAFHPFFTTKPAGTGTGLGLSIAYDIIVKEHHGSIDVASDEKQFTQLTINLPLNEGGL